MNLSLSNNNNTLLPPTFVSDITLTVPQQDTIVQLRVTMAFLTLFGSIFIVLSTFLFKRWRIQPSRFVLALTLFAMLEGIANLMSLGGVYKEGQSSPACYAQGFLLQFSQNGIFIWITCIAVNLYRVVCLNKPTEREWIFYKIGILWPILTALIPLSSNAYGPAGIWCWLTRSAGQPYRWALFYIPLFIQIIVVIVLYVLIILAINQALDTTPQDIDEARKKNARLLLRRLKAYPILFLLMYIFPIISRIYDASNPINSFFLFFMQSLTAPSIGFVNCIAYGFDSELRRDWYNFLIKRIGVFPLSYCCLYPEDGVVDPQEDKSDVFEDDHTETNDDIIELK